MHAKIILKKQRMSFHYSALHKIKLHLCVKEKNNVTHNLFSHVLIKVSSKTKTSYRKITSSL